MTTVNALTTNEVTLTTPDTPLDSVRERITQAAGVVAPSEADLAVIVEACDEANRAADELLPVAARFIEAFRRADELAGPLQNLIALEGGPAWDDAWETIAVAVGYHRVDALSAMLCRDFYPATEPFSADYVEGIRARYGAAVRPATAVDDMSVEELDAVPEDAAQAKRIAELERETHRLRCRLSGIDALAHPAGAR